MNDLAVLIGLKVVIAMTCVQAAFGETWVVYDLAVLASMLICLITYSVYIQRLVDFQPQDTYQVYDSLGGAQARLLLPKKQDSSVDNGELAASDSYRPKLHFMSAVSATASFTLDDARPCMLRCGACSFPSDVGATEHTNAASTVSKQTSGAAD